MHHGPRGGNEIGLSNVVTFFFLLHHATNEIRQIFVGDPALYQLMQIVIPHRE
jgi:hypothetical protein